MKKIRMRLSAVLLVIMGGLCAAAQADTAGEATYSYFYNCYDWHCSAHYAGLEYDRPQLNENADILMFILNSRLIRDVSAYTAQEVVASDPDLAIAYCCDAQTAISRVQPHNQYRRINLEDAAYYDRETAARIRAIVRSGYQSTWSDAQRDAAQAQANAWLRTKGMETIENLTHAQAMTATQLAIWMNANKNSLMSAEYAGMHDYSRYDVTTYDPVKVPSGVPDDAQVRHELDRANQKNVELFKQYLLGLEGASPKTVIFTEEHFVADSAVYAMDAGLHDVTLRFTLEGTVSSQDSLTLAVRIGDIKRSYRLGKDATLFCDDLGYYSISFDQMDAEMLEAGIEMTISGTQILADDAYFYEPKTLEGEDARKVSQNLVGYQTAGEKTLVFAACTLSVEPKEIVILGHEDIPQTGDRGLFPWLTILCLAAFFAGKQRIT